MSLDIKGYDGIFFVPDPNSDNDGGLELSFFHFNDEYANKESVDNTSLGDMYYVAFFKGDEEGDMTFDGNFEAIFSDPQVYLKSLAGMHIFGCLVRKTENSGKWFQNYLKNALEKVKMYEEKGDKL